MKLEIKTILELFQNAYDRRDPNYVEDFMSLLFAKETDPVIIGTGEGEIYFDYEGCKELFVNDWKYWGFEQLDIDKAKVLELENFTVVHVPATFSFKFVVNNENRVDHFQDILDKMRIDSKDKRDLKIKMGEINYELVHIYHDRPSQERKYQFDLTVTFIINDDNKVIQINFSVPDNLFRPDSRLYEQSYFNRCLDYELKKIRNSKSLEDSQEIKNIRVFLKELFKNYFIDGLKYFDNSNMLVSIPDNKKATNLNELKALIEYQNQYHDALSVFEEDAAIKVSGNNAVVITKLVSNKIIDRETYFEKTRKEILALETNNSMTITEKMFKIRQLISIAFKETIISDAYDIPIRLHMVLSKEKGKWVVNYMQQSYSFYYLLEERNEFMRLIEAK